MFRSRANALKRSRDFFDLFTAAKAPNKAKRRFQLEPLEPRVLLSADVDPLASTALLSHPALYTRSTTASLAIDTSRDANLAPLDAIATTGANSRAAIAPQSTILFGEARPLPGSGISGQGFYATLAAGATDETSIALEAGVTLTFTVNPNGTPMRLGVEVLDPLGNVVASAQASAVRDRVTTDLITIPSAGDYLFRVTSLEGSGEFFADAFINTMFDPSDTGGTFDLTAAETPLPGGGTRAGAIGLVQFSTDTYTFSAAAGDLFSVAVADRDELGNSPAPNVRILDPDGLEIAAGVQNSLNAAITIPNVVAKKSGTYSVTITPTEAAGGAFFGYDLVVTKGATFETDRGDLPSAQGSGSGFQAESPRDITLNTPWVGPSGVALGGSTGGAFLTRIAVVGDANADGLVQQIRDLQGAPFEVTRVTGADIDTLAELDAFDVVVLSGQSSADTALAAAIPTLHEWVQDQGHAVVTTGFGIFPVDGINTQDFDDLVAFDMTKQVIAGAVFDAVTATGSHPIVAGFGQNFGLFGIAYQGKADAGADIVATTPDGRPIVVAKQVGHGRSVALAPSYGDPGSPGTLRNQDGSQLLAQALLWATGNQAFDSSDDYVVAVNAGDTVAVSAARSNRDAGLPTTDLTLGLDIFRANGELIASNGDPDPAASFTADRTETLIVRVNTGGSGGYRLQVTGATGTPPLFASTQIPQTALAAATPLIRELGTTFRVDFSAPLDLQTISADALRFDGIAATAVTIVDGDTLLFTLPTTPGDGDHQIEIVGGTLASVDGRVYGGRTIDFTLDSTPPNIVSSTIAPNAVLDIDPLQVTIGFSEPLDAALIDSVFDAFLFNLDTNTTVPITALSYDAETKSVTIATTQVLDEANYNLDLFGDFRDRAGNRLDGFPNDSIPSGNGSEDGFWILPFKVRGLNSEVPALPAVGPAGGEVYATTLDRGLPPGDIDDFQVTVEAGAKLSVGLSPQGALAASIVVLDSAATVVASANAAANGDGVVIPPTVLSGGTYTIRVANVSGTGRYALTLALNAVISAEGGAVDDGVPAGAISLEPSASSARLGGVGEIGSATDLDIFTLDLAAGDRIDLGLEATLGDARRLVATIIDPNGDEITRSASTTDGAQRIDRLVASSAGTYEVRIAQRADNGGLAATDPVRYAFAITRNAQLAPGAAEDVPVTAGQIFGRTGNAGATSGAIRVAIHGLDAAALAARDALNDSTAFRFEAVAVDGGGLDTLAELAAYDVVILGDFNVQAQYEAIAPALKEFVLRGGAVVATGYTILGAGESSGAPVSAIDDIVPVNTSGSSATLGNSVLTTNGIVHPITAGISPFFFGSSEYPAGGVDPGATVLATGAGTIPLVVADSRGAGRSVYLGLPYASGGGAALRSGAPDRLFEQAVAWAAQPGDSYIVDLAAGQSVTFSTRTPFTGAGDPQTAFDAKLIVTGPDGTEIATNSSIAPGDSNAGIAFTAALAGRYHVRIVSEAGRGDYELDTDARANPAPFAVASTSIPDGGAFTSIANEITLTLSDNVFLASVAASDLTINGVSANAVRVVDGRTLVFDITGLAATEGTYSIALAAGALVNAAGSALAPFTASFAIDRTAPAVTSITPDSIVSPLNTIVVTFNEAIDAATVDTGDLTILDPHGFQYGPSSVTVSGNVATFRLFNNFAAGSYTVTLGPNIRDLAGNRMAAAVSDGITVASPDLVVTNVSTSPSGRFGDTISLTYTVKNIGDAPLSGQWDDWLLLSTDNQRGFDAATGTFDTGLRTVRITDFAGGAVLAAGQSYTRTVDVTLPYRFTDFTAGTYYLLAAANPFFGGPGENTGDNNTGASAPIALSLPPSPDLQVRALTMPASAFFGQQVTLNWTDFNAGTGDAAGNWTDRIYYSPDANLETGFFGDALLASIDVTRTANPLAPGQGASQSATVTIPFDGSSDPNRTYYFFVVTDISNAIYEHRAETNNSASASPALALPPLLDLRVDSTSVSDTTPNAGDTIIVTYTVTNYGSGTITGDWSDRIALTIRPQLYTYQYLQTVPVTGITLAPGQSYTRSVDVLLPLSHSYEPGAWGIQVTTDALGQVFEYQAEQNNDGPNIDVTISNPPLPDLQISAIDVAAAAQFGRNLHLTYTGTNAGTAPATGTWNDYIYLSLGDAVIDPQDRLLWVGPANAGPLAAGASYSRTLDLTLPLEPSVVNGNYSLIVVTDPVLPFQGSQVYEATANETNNQRAAPLSVTIPPLPDLQVSALTAPIEAISGQRVPISWTDFNAGTAAATGWTDRVFLSNDAILDGNDLQIGNDIRFDGTLAAGASVPLTVDFTLPETLSGFRYVIVQTDAANEHYEFPNETNNTRTAAQATNIALKDFPNLQVASIATPANAASSQPIDVVWRVTNAGTGPTTVPVWRDYVYLSTDSVLDRADVLLGSVENPSYLAPGQSYESRLTAILPRGIEGAYRILVVTDRNNAVFEFGGEGDNVRVSDSVTIAQTPPPNLQVSEVAAPATAVTGDPMALSYIVTNVGGSRTFESRWSDRIFISQDQVIDGSDTLLATLEHTGALQDGASYAVSTSVIPPIGKAGPFYFLVRTDAFSEVFEGANEDDNTGFDPVATNVVHRPPPDLATTITSAPAGALAGHAISVGFTISNDGATATPQTHWANSVYLSTDATLDAGDALLDSFVQSAGQLQPGQSIAATRSVRLPSFISGDYFLIVAGDSANEVFEFDDANNIVARALHIDSRPADLVVPTVAAPEGAIAGRQIAVSWTTTNAGTGPTSNATWFDRIVLSRNDVFGDGDDIFLNDIEVTGALAAGASSTETAFLSLPYEAVGTYFLLVNADQRTTDPDKTVDESDETNNVGKVALSVTQNVPDLRVTIVTAPPAIGVGQPFNVGFTIVNDGNAITNASTWIDRIYLSTDGAYDASDRLIGSVRRTNPLAPGESYSALANITLPSDVPTGTYRIIVFTDRDNGVFERPFEDNNATASGSIAVTGLAPLVPNLTVSAVDAPDNAISGQSMTLTYTVTNTGDDLTGTWFDSLFLSADQTLQRGADVFLGYKAQNRTLRAGESYTETFDAVIPKGYAGPYYFFVATDSTNRVTTERSETDNSGYDGRSTLIALPTPTDLTIGTVTIPPTLTLGGEATITYTVNNNSAGTAFGAWYDSVYLSADGIWDVGDRLIGRILHKGDVAAGSSYSETLTARVPGVLPGDYRVIVRTDIRNNVDEANEANNIGGSLDAASVDVPTLALGGSATGALPNGGTTYYRLVAEAGQTIRLFLHGDNASRGNELYVGFGTVPERGAFDISAATPFEADQELIIPTSQAGIYYIAVVNGTAGTGAPGGFSLSAESLPFAIRSLARSSVGNSGEATLKINGARFEPGTSFSLLDNQGQALAARRTVISDASRAYATFDLFGTPAGKYSIAALAPNGAVSTIADAVTVVDGQGSAIADAIDGPGEVRRFSINNVTYHWTNTGDTDTGAPLIRVSANGTFGYDASRLRPGLFLALGSSTEGPSDVLRPGGESAMTFAFSAGTAMEFDTVKTDSAEAITDWTPIRDALKPNALSDAQWLPFWNRIQADIAPEWGALAKFINRVALDVAQPGEALRDIHEIFTRLYAKSPEFRVSVSASGVLLDSQTGLALAGVAIAAYRDTPLGHVYGASAITDVNGAFTFAGLVAGTYTYAFETGSPYDFDQDRDGVADRFFSTFVVGDSTDVSGLTVYAHDIIQQSDLAETSRPQLVTTSDGLTHLFFEVNGSLWQAVEQSGEWVDAAQIPPGISGRYVATASDNLIDGTKSGVVVAWVRDDGTRNNQEIYYTIGLRTGTGFSWSTPAKVATTPVADTNPQVSVDDQGRILVVYTSRDESKPDDGDLYYTLIDTNGTQLTFTSEEAAVVKQLDQTWKAALEAANGDITEQLGKKGSLDYKIPLDLSKGKLASITNGYAIKGEASIGVNWDVGDREVKAGGKLGAKSSFKKSEDKFGFGSLGKGNDFELKLGAEGAYQGTWKAVGCADPYWKLVSAKLQGRIEAGFAVKVPLENAIPWTVPTSVLKGALNYIRWMGLATIDLGLEVAGGIGVRANWKNPEAPPAAIRLPDYGKLFFNFSIQPTINFELFPDVYSFPQNLIKLQIGGSLKFQGDVGFPGAADDSEPNEGKLTGELFIAVGGRLVTRDPDKMLKLTLPAEDLFQSDVAGVGLASLAAEPTATGGTVEVITDPNASRGSHAVYVGGGAAALDANVANNLTDESKPLLVRSPTGETVALWLGSPTGDPRATAIMLSRFNGTVWSTAEALAGTEGALDVPAAAFDASGRLVIVWSEQSQNAPTLSNGLLDQAGLDALTTLQNSIDLHYAVLDNGVISPAQLLASTAGPDSAMVLARVGSNLVLAWLNGDLTTGFGAVDTAIWNGLNWSGPVAIGGGERVENITVGGAGSDIRVFWSEDMDPQEGTNIQLRQNARNAGIWGTERGFDPTLLATRVAGEQIAAIKGLQAETHTRQIAALGTQANAPVAAEGAGLAEVIFGPPKPDYSAECDEEKEKLKYAPPIQRPSDPNDIVGPKGSGEENWITADQPLAYTILFENKASATGPAQTARIVQQLDADLDIRTFRVDDFGWGGLIFAQGGDQAYFLGRIDLSATRGYAVEVLVLPDSTTNTVTWTFTTIDPATGEPTQDARQGFLPPDIADGIGQAFVSYSIRPRAGVPTGTRIDAKATIIFDTEEPIETPAIFNTLDTVKPTSAVAALPAEIEGTTVELDWGGLDDANGSAIASYSVYVSRDGGDYQLYLLDTDRTSALFEGAAGSLYSFYTIAKDFAGNVEAAPLTADTRAAFGVLAPGAITGRVFIDSDGDGVFEAGEAGRSGITVFIDADANGQFDAGETSALTDAAGLYTFATIRPGAVTIAFLPPAGDTATTPTSALVTVAPAATAAADFGLYTPGAIAGFAFSDLNQDGIRNGGETGLAGRTIFIDANDNGTLDPGERQVLTGADGSYRFAGLAAGVTVLRQVLPAHVAATGASRIAVTVTSGLDAQNRDFASIALASIAGVKFEDVDGNRARDAGEPLLAGWTIFLDANQNGLLDAGERATITGADGVYRFDDVRPGTYTVAEVLQPGWRQTYPGPIAAAAGAQLETSASGARIESPDLALADAAPLAVGDAFRASLLTGLDGYRADARFATHNGSGIRVVTIDTGIDVDSRFFGPDLDGNGISDRIAFQWDFADNDADASDRSGHGSNVASIIAGGDANYPGVAPAADIIALKVFSDSGAGYFLYVEKALQWVVANAAAFGVGVVNLSLGDGGNWLTSASRYGLGDELAALAAEGIIVTAASGNSYYTFDATPGISYPAADPNVIAVGAVWSADYGGPWHFANGATDLTTTADAIASFSQRGPLTDIFAPGARLTGANATGGTVTMQGTSQASAYLAGVAALAQELALDHLGRRLTGAEFAALAQQSGVVIVDGDDENDNVRNTGASYRRVNIEALAQAIIALPAGAGTGGTGAGDGGGTHSVPARALDGHALSVGVGDALTAIDFGNFKLGSVSGLVFDDLDGDGQRLPGEAGLSGRTIFLDANNNGALDAGETSTLTGADGTWSFADLGPGAIHIREIVPPGSIATTPVSFDATITSRAVLTATAFGTFALGTATGAVFNDRDANGLRDAGETGLAGRTIFLDANNNGALDAGEASTLTAVDGTWSFGNLGPGTIHIREIVPLGWAATTPTLFDALITSGAAPNTLFGTRDLPPVAVGDRYAMDGATTLSVLPAGVLANDFDIGGGAITAALVTGPANGRLALGNDGGFTYTPNAGFAGDDQFTYAAVDLAGNQTNAVVTITVRPVIINRSPVAVRDVVTLSAAAASLIDVLANDTDPDRDPLRLVPGQLPAASALGAALTISGGKVSYDPTASAQLLALRAGQSLTDTFQYGIDDGRGGSATGTVTVTVRGVNDAPRPVADAAATNEDTAITINVLANDQDPDGDRLAVSAAATRSVLGAAVIVLADGSVRYDPTGALALQRLAEGATVDDTFTYSVIDPFGARASATVTIRVTGVNDAPVAAPDNAATNEDLAITIDVRRNDSDLETPQAQVIVGGLSGRSALGATLTLDAQGRVVYDPTMAAALQALELGQSADDSFTYSITDGAGAASIGTVLVRVAGRQDVTVEVNAATNEDTAITVPLAGLTLISASSKNAIVSIVPGGLRYDPTTSPALQALTTRANPSFIDPVAFVARNAAGQLVQGRLLVTVGGVEDSPTTSGATLATGADLAVSVDPLSLTRDIDLGAVLTLQSFAAASVLGASVTLVNGALVYDPTASVTLGALFVGQIVTDSFTYTVSDETGRAVTGTVKVVVSGRNNTAIVDFAGQTTGEDNLLTFRPAPGVTPLGTNALSPLGASVRVVAGGNLRYDPRAAAALQALNGGESANDTVLFTFRDAGGALRLGRVAVLVIGADEPLQLRNDTAAAGNLAAVTIDVARNDILPAGSVLSVPAQSSLGAALLLVDGKITFDPTVSASLRGLAVGQTVSDTFTYSAREPGGATATATVTIRVTGRNTPPVAVEDRVETAANAPLVIRPAANDTDLQSPASALVIQSVAPSSAFGASVTLLGDGSVRYNPSAAARIIKLRPGESALDSFTYIIADEQGATARGTVFITVNGVNDPPLAKDDEARADDNVITRIAVRANDTDPDEIVPLTVSVGGTSRLGATLSVEADGRVAYDPRSVLASLAFGQTATDTFTYTVTDAGGLTSTATVTVIVQGRNAPPVANADSATIVAGAPAAITVLANDTDIDDGAILAIARLDARSQLGATLTVNADGSVRYDAATSAVLTALRPNQSRIDRFTYTVTDEFGATRTATVTVTVWGAGTPGVLALEPAAAPRIAPIAVDLGRAFDGFAATSISSGGAWQESFVAGTGPAKDPNAGIKITLQ